MPTQAVSGDPIVLVVDLKEFRRALVVRFLEDWAAAEKIGLLSLVPEDAHATLREGIDCRMIIFNVGGASCSKGTLAEITVLRALAPSAPLVVLADEEVPEDIVAVMRSGAEGYLSNHSAPDLVLRALTFVLEGGTYVPRSAVAHATFPEEQPLKGDREAHGACIQDVEGEEIDAEPTSAANTALSSSFPRLELSGRQHSVLEGVCRGEPNKIIGRALNLPESTVKVHVREIMRKLSVSNRTQVAVVASRMGFALAEKQALCCSRQHEELPLQQSSRGLANAGPATSNEARAIVGSNAGSNVDSLHELSFGNLVHRKIPKPS
jgi:DNA-binding NarL/FixJ family response regulator